MSLKPFSEVIKSRRKKTGTTQTDLEQLTGISVYRIQQMEKGTYRFKSIYEIERLVNALQMGERGKKMFIYELSEYVQVPKYVHIPRGTDIVKYELENDDD